MLMGFFKPLLGEAGLIDENNASDPMNAAISLADAAAFAEFAVHGVEAVGGMGDGIDFSGVMPAPDPAPTIAPQAPTLQTANIPNMEMGMKMSP